MDESTLKVLISNLERSRATLDSWLFVFTLFVVVGVVLEVVFVIWEYRDELHDWRRGIVHPPEKPSVALLIFGLLGAGLVAIGVTGELYIGAKIGAKETSIREANDQRASLLSKLAGDAAKSAKTAHDEAAAAKKDSNEAKTEASNSLSLTRSARREVRQLRSNIEKAEEEAFESQLDLKRSLYQSFQQTGNRTIDPFMFLHILKGRPTGNVVLWVKVDGGEPHQYAWQIWHTVNRSPGWTAQIKHVEEKPPSPLRPIFVTGIYIRCRTLPNSDDWLRTPKTACEALVDAVMQGTNGPPFGAPTDSDPTLGDDEIAIEVYTQPKPLIAPATPSKK